MEIFHFHNVSQKNINLVLQIIALIVISKIANDSNTDIYLNHYSNTTQENLNNLQNQYVEDLEILFRKYYHNRKMNT